MVDQNNIKSYDQLELAELIFKKQFELNPQMAKEYNNHQKRLMMEDIIYNLEYLFTAIELDDHRLFTDYVRWLVHLLWSLRKNHDKGQVNQRLIEHFEIMKNVLESAGVDAVVYINSAIEALKQEELAPTYPMQFQEDKYSKFKQEYLNLLLSNATHEAIDYLASLNRKGLAVDEILQFVIQDVMYQIGELWHQNIITVDVEHYCTSTTQVAIAQFYPQIFTKARNGHKIMTCCVGSELHELGIRMLSDIFEYNGWDSIYLGASLPTKAIITALEKHKPDLLALSVTMPNHLPKCLAIIQEVKTLYPDIKIAVGGRAFRFTESIWEKWNIDISTENAFQLVQWAKEQIIEGPRNQC